MSQLLRVQNFAVSIDGFGAGEGQSLERPFGPASPADLMSWAGATASWPNRTEPGGSRGLDDYFTRDFCLGTSAPRSWTGTSSDPSVGRGMPLDWEGVVGGHPALPHPGVRSHASSCDPAFTLADTTFHFLDADPRMRGSGPSRRR